MMRSRFFKPANVDDRCGQQNAGQNHSIDAAAHRKGRQAVGDEQDDQGADKRLGDRTSAAAEADAAEHRGGERGDFEADADVAADRAEPCREKQRATGGQRAARRITASDRRADRNARVIGRPPGTADSHDMPARPEPCQQNVTE
jgi:hypothetical protein